MSLSGRTRGLVMAGFTCLAPAASGQATWYVDQANCPGPGSGSAADPFCAIQTGIDASADGDTVIVADGTYAGDGNRDLDFGGRVITLRSENGPDGCIIDSQGSLDQPHRGFHFHRGESAGAVVEGFGIVGGFAGWGKGGGVLIQQSGPTVRNCLFEGNEAYSGGGLAVAAGSATVGQCVFRKNTASSAGGGVYGADSTVVVSRCVFAGNSATSGGGIANVAGVLTLLNSRLVGNVARDGGGVSHVNSSVEALLVHCTVSGNTAWSLGGGIRGGAGSRAVLHNCIVWGNRSDQIIGDATLTFSDVQGGFAGLGVLGVNPRFVRDPGPGGDGLWGTEDDDFGDLHLSPLSPCIDAGDSAAVPPGSATDLDGDPRVVDLPCVADIGNPPGAAVADMGADEVADVDCNGSGTPDVCDILVGASQDCSWNGVPDECEPDCNGNGRADSCDIADGVSGDCNGDWIPDECQADADGDAVPNACDICPGGDDSVDGDGDGTPDGCDGDHVWYVDDDAPGDPGPGDPTVSDAEEDGSSEHPFDAIQEGITRAQDGDQVVVADGKYTGRGNRNLNFGGRWISVRSAGGADKSVIDCDGYGRGFEFTSGETAAARVIGLTIANCSVGIGVFSVESAGGGIYAVGSSPTVSDCVLRYNRALSIVYPDVARGGGMYNRNCSPTVTRCRFVDNFVYAPSEGETRGGGMYNFNSNPRLDHCTFFGNASVAGDGGAMYNEHSSPVLTNCAVAGNHSYVAGMRNTLHSAATLFNCILWDNGSNAIRDTGSVTTVRYTDVEFGWPGAGNIDADPRFADAGNGDLRLLPDSPCIDAGDSGAVAAGVFTDLDGGARLVDLAAVADTGDSHGLGPVVDMGAFEVREDCNGNEVPDAQDIGSGVSADCDGNRVPDECEADCDGNGAADACDLDAGALDCNGNGAPDGCESDADCNRNGLQDVCDIFEGNSADCNGNMIPDECEPDCNQNGTVDACDITAGLSEDCNANAVPDECDIGAELTDDLNTNWVPDECEVLPVGGDLDADGDVDVFDFAVFVLCASGPGGGVASPLCAAFDFDGDGDVDRGDGRMLQIAAGGCGVTITRQPQDTAACAGDDAVVAVEAIGVQVGYQWFFNDEPIAGAAEATLVIEQAEPEDVGFYRCEVTPVCGGPVSSSAAELAVSAGMVVFETQPVGATVCAGASYFMFANATGAPAYQWFKDGDAVSGATQPFYVITNASFANAGVYHVAAGNACDAATSDSAVVDVIDCGAAGGP